MAAIADNLEADFPFADTADIHVSMLMTRRGSLCNTYNEQISTIDDLITYINDVKPLGSDPKHVVQRLKVCYYRMQFYVKQENSNLKFNQRDNHITSS